MSESERIILRKLIERLERELPSLSRAERQKLAGYWDGEQPPAPDGLGHKVAALDWAKKALASGDDDDIRQAALHAPPLERTGKEMAAKFAAKRRGAGQASDAARRKAEINSLAAEYAARGYDRKTIAGKIADERPDLGAEGQIYKIICLSKTAG